jgi:hypothetical protein
MAQKTRLSGQNKPKGGGKQGAGGFDKTAAIRKVEVPIPSAGLYQFGQDVTSAERVWVEWMPSAVLEGKRRRAFLSKQGIVDPSAILTDSGVQLPRKGMSCHMHGRSAVVMGAGKFNIWIAGERDQRASTATARQLSSQLLDMIAPGSVVPVTRRTHSPAPSSSSRRS